jgi:hypothetical protein
MPDDPIILLPCPYCGSEPRLQTQVVIMCSNGTSCGVRPRSVSTSEEIAAAKWNARFSEVDTETGEIT